MIRLYDNEKPIQSFNTLLCFAFGVALLGVSIAGGTLSGYHLFLAAITILLNSIARFEFEIESEDEDDENKKAIGQTE